MNKNNTFSNFLSIMHQRPQATAIVSGNQNHPQIHGIIRFYQTNIGVIVTANVTGLPSYGECEDPVFGFHIHSGADCTGTEKDPFANSLMHYNPNNCTHPHHAGDMPPLFGNKGQALCAFLTDRFTVREIIGKTVIIHSLPDDFITQPSGNSGEKMACGKIMRI